MNCHDPQHIEVGPLSEGDFYTSSRKVCKTCRKRYTAAINKRVAVRMRDGRSSKVFSRVIEETPEEAARKLEQLEKFYGGIEEPYQHASLRAEQPHSQGGEFLDFFSPEKVFGLGLYQTQFLRVGNDKNLVQKWEGKTVGTFHRGCTR